MRSGYWQDFTTAELTGLDRERSVALLPVGAIEQHGPHLPLATDALIAGALAAGALERIGDTATLLVLPAVNVGHSPEHEAYAGTLSIRLETLLDVWIAIARGAARAGLRKLVILNAHGGQTALVHLAAVRLRAELGLLAVRANYFSFGTPPGLFAAAELRHGLHGGEVETSLMLHLRPDLVRRERLEAFGGLPERLAARGGLLGVEKPIGIGWLSADLHPAGVCGNAARADAARGAVYLEFLCGRLAALVAEVAATPLSILAG